MAAHLRRKLTADEFIAWAMQQPEGKGNVYLALRQAVRARGLPCWTYTDGMSVRIDDHTVYEPDALIRCGTASSRCRRGA